MQRCAHWHGVRVFLLISQNWEVYPALNMHIRQVLFMSVTTAFCRISATLFDTLVNLKIENDDISLSHLQARWFVNYIFLAGQAVGSGCYCCGCSPAGCWCSLCRGLAVVWWYSWHCSPSSPSNIGGILSRSVKRWKSSVKLILRECSPGFGFYSKIKVEIQTSFPFRDMFLRGNRILDA